MSETIHKGFVIIPLVLVSFGFYLLTNAAEPPGLSKLSGAEKTRVAKLIEGARKEGALIGYTSTFRLDAQTNMFPTFREWYGFSATDLRINLVSMRTDAIVTKVTEELRAKIYKTDIVQSATVDWFDELVVKGEIMPYDSPEYRHFCPMSVDPAIAPANPPYFIAGVFSGRSILYNPKYVKGEIAHWKDVLRPEYKGKISCADVSNSTSHTDAYIPLRKVLDVSFFRQLAKQDPFLLVSTQDLVNKAISGEYPIAVMGSATPAFRANLQGAGLKMVFPSEGWPVMGAPIAIINHAPHPNASKLFIDFYHSEAGQKIILEDGHAIGRLGVRSKYPEYPRAIYDIKGAIPMDWHKLTSKERDNAREEFRRVVIEKK